MEQYGRGSIAARVARQASQNQNQIVQGGTAPDMSQATTVAPSGGGSILSRLGISGGSSNLSQAREALAEGGTFNVEERNFTFTDKETGEVFDMSQALTGDQASDEQNMIIGQHSNHGMLSNSELQGAGQVAVLDGAGNPLNAVTRDVEIKLADGTTKTVEMTSYSDANQFQSDPEKRRELTLRAARRNLIEVFGEDSDLIDKYVRLFSEGIDNKTQSKTIERALQNTKIATLDQDKFQQLMNTNTQNSALAKAMAKTKGPTRSEVHEGVYNEQSKDGSGLSYSSIASEAITVDGASGNFNFSTRYSDFKTSDKVGAIISKDSEAFMTDAGLAYTGTGVAKFEGLRLTAQTAKQGALGTVDAGRANGTYGTIMKSAVGDNLILDHKDTDTSTPGWEISESYNNKISFLVDNQIIENPGRMKFENKEEELEFKAAAIAYYDKQVHPQLLSIYKKGISTHGENYKNKLLNMHAADKELARELYSLKSRLATVNDVSLGTGNTGGAILNNRINILNESNTFMGGASSFKGEFGVEYSGYDFESISKEMNLMSRYSDKAQYIQNLAENNVITSEAAEVMNDLARFQEVNSRGLNDGIDAIESRLGLGGGSDQVSKVDKEINKGGMAFVPVGPMNQHHLSGIQYSKEAGGFVSGGKRTGIKFGMKSTLEAQDKVAVNRANFTTKLNNNYSNLINQDGLNLSKEQYFGILRKKFAAEYTKDNNFGLGEEEYKSMQDLFNDSTDEELVSYSLNIDKATRIPSS